MGLEIFVTGATLSHQIEKEKYFKKAMYQKDQYKKFGVRLRRAIGLVELFSQHGTQLKEDTFYVKKDKVLALMNEVLQKNPFSTDLESYDTIAYFFLMGHLEEHRHALESKSKDEFVLLFELSY